MKATVPPDARDNARAFFARRFLGTFEAMGRAIEDAVAALRKRGHIAAADEPCARLCLEEALVNAIRHGNKGDDRAEVGLEIEDGDDCCTIRVYDQGAGFCPDTVRMPESDAIGGRGVCLMRHYMDRVVYDQARRCLAMTFRRKGAPTEGGSAP